MANKKNNYLDNKEFYRAICEWKKHSREAEECGDPKPPLTNFIGECIQKIAVNTSYRSNFNKYPFKEEMVGDAIEQCIRYFDNYDPDKNTNAFGYFSRIIWNAFIRRIEKEHKQMYVNYKVLVNNQVHGELTNEQAVDADQDYNITSVYADNDVINDFVTKFERRQEEKKEKRREKRNLETFIDKSDSDSTNDEEK